MSLCCRQWPCKAGLHVREGLWAFLWTALLLCSCAVVGVLAALDFAQSVALSVLLIVGGAGLVAMYHCLRLRAAGRASDVSHRKLRRYLRSRLLCDGVALEHRYVATRFDGGAAVSAY